MRVEQRRRQPSHHKNRLHVSIDLKITYHLFRRLTFKQIYKIQLYKGNVAIRDWVFQTSAASKIGGHIGGFVGGVFFMNRSIIRYLIASVDWLICNL